MLFRSTPKHTALFRLTLSAFLLAIVVVVLGAFTRLVDAGLGCPDWPGCYGHLLWPNESHEIAKAEEAFPSTPVKTDKTWPEMVHRYFAGALVLFILAIFIISLRQSKAMVLMGLERLPVKLPLFLLCLVMLQAAFGMWTVTLKLWPQVVTAHLLGGFSTLSFLWLLNQRLGGQRWVLMGRELELIQKLKPLLLLSLIVVIVQIALGGWVSSNYAALACPDFPQCLGQWIPPMDVQTGFNISQDIGPNYLGGQLDNHSRTAIHFFHRIGALTVLVVFSALSAMLWRTGAKVVRSWALLLLCVLGLQLVLGMSNIVWALPLVVAVAHHAVGALLLLVMVSICYRVYTASIK
ncbi:cytochrome B [Candidatus Endobugula sertula]|uniref:Cytochrome B n=1 Tax=Candidatus Endobugula sertula TaxID=62101 RepID=A0A1D2QQZ5_9GAMM|nr:cytochrome B [Candidatus Endobugula sertula]